MSKLDFLFIAGLIISSDKIMVILAFIGCFIYLDFAISDYKYVMLSKKIDGCMAALEINCNPKGLENLQDLINKRRSLSVLECNLIHKLLVNIPVRRSRQSGMMRQDIHTYKIVKQ